MHDFNTKLALLNQDVSPVINLSDTIDFGQAS